MKKFTKYLVIFLVAIVIIDLANRLVYSYAFAHIPLDSKIGDEYKFVINNTQSDILIIGASRAVHHYNPSLIEDSLCVTCFNAGFDGTGIVHNYLALIKAFENGKVSTVIFDVSPAQLQKAWNTEKLSQVFPFYWKHDSVKVLVDEILPFHQRMWLASSLIQYNSNLYDIIRENITKSEAVKGFIALPASVQIPANRFQLIEETESFIPFSPAEDVFNRMVQLCKDNGSRLILCFSPTTVYNPSFAEYLVNYARRKDVEFWDDGRLEELMGPEYFKDASHLNITGANIFTNRIIERLHHESKENGCGN